MHFKEHLNFKHLSKELRNHCNCIHYVRNVVLQEDLAWGTRSDGE